MPADGYNREEAWDDYYKKHGLEKSGETDYRGFAELMAERGTKGYDKGEKEFGSPDKSKHKEFNFTYPDEPQAKLDLHGMTVDEALPAVEKFVRDCREMQMNFVIIVPGIGRNSVDGRAKLRPLVVNKLVDLQNNQRIRNFKTAEPKHGGLGAVYVYLK